MTGCSLPQTALREAKDANPAVWKLRLNTVAVRCLDLHDERGW